jgi:hypothetical protein
MSAIKGPNIITTGLVLALDAANTRSFKGEPTTNILASYVNPTFENGTKTADGWAFDAKTNGTYDYSTDAYNGTYSVRIQNSTISSIAFWRANIPVVSGQKYTMSIYAKNINCPTVPFFSGVNISLDSGQTASFTGINNEWQRFTATFTATATGNAQFYVRTDNNATQGFFLIDNFQIEQKAYATPFVNGTRGTIMAAGGGWVDQSGTGNHGELVNGPTFSDNNFGSLVFDGINDSITIPDNSTLDLSGNKTLCCWVYMGANSSGCGIVGKSNSTVAGMALGYGWNGNGFMALAWNSTNNPFIVKDLNRDILKWNYLAAVQDGATRYIYVHDAEGMRSSSHSGGTHSWDNTQAFTIGNANNGSNLAPSNTRIAQTSIYNRALTSQEVLQNYNATRGRFGL